MAIHTRTPDTKNKNNPLVIAGLAALIVLAIFTGVKLMSHQEVITLQDTPGITYMKQKAVECKGDYSKLSPEEQGKVEEYSNRHGAMSIAMYYHPSQGN